MRTNRSLVSWFGLVLLGLISGSLLPTDAAAQRSAPQEPVAPPEGWIDGAIEWRSVGPANMSGRITSIAVYEADPTIWWAATASGGLLKTTNDGRTFEHQFDREATVSIGDVQVFQGNPDIVWVGTGEANPRNSASWGNGVYRSTDGGKSWTHCGLDKTFQTGRIALHPTDPLIAYVGSLGRLWGPNEDRGLYKTTDGGQTWTKILYVDDKTGIIDVQMSPADPQTLIVATYERQRDGFDGNDPAKKNGPGSALWKTTDGGATFRKLTNGLPTVNLGRIGLSWYRQDPNYVYAIVETEKTGAEPENAPWFGVRGEDADVGARIVEVTADGPAAKAELKVDDIVVQIDGQTVASYQDLLAKVRRFEAGQTVKLQVARQRELLDLEVTFTQRPQTPQRGGNNPDRETQAGARSPFDGGLGGQLPNYEDQQGSAGQEFGGVFQSADGGETWTRINSVNPRPMYYSQIRVDPSDLNFVYVLGTELYKSKNGGHDFTDDGHGGDVHVDHHALWIDPRDGRHMILGNDGGLYVTRDRMAQWDHLNHVAIGQFYHVGLSANRNYRIVGGLQDNGSWGGPSRVANGPGPVNTDWYRVGGGDGFVCLVDPEDPDQIYFESQNGAMGRINLRTGERGFIRPRAPQGTSYRFNWKTPFLLSPHNPRIHYSAGNYVFRSVARGDSLRAISPEITRTEQGSGSAIAESPQSEGIVYVGTTDGWVWVTVDQGKTWVNVFEDPSALVPPADQRGPGGPGGRGGFGGGPGGGG
ncbi:MAG TPA: PDZ domain-containing protein, partial [Pirellulaceae bacterium]|nr:PDZ domain-containing protein [Pirellulaceae bacterium]